MRPIDRGPAPQEFDHYQEDKPFLVARLGDYCSYCERPIKTNLAVEHVLPKSLHPESETDWNNFVLGCVNCNSTKGDKPVDRSLTLLPDQDNTLLAFVYSSLGEVSPQESLSPSLEGMARSVLKLTGLDKFPDELEGELFIAALERWQQRSQAWHVAEESLETLAEHDTPGLRRQILLTARNTGFFSVWLQVFREDANMCRSLILAFPGTSSDCFDDTGTPVNRPGGHL